MRIRNLIFACILLGLCLYIVHPSMAEEIRTGSLAGELCMPAERASAPVLIIPGSGPVNRDGNMPNLTPGMYKLLAEELLQNGVPSVRIDKRGMYGSAAQGVDANDVTLAKYADDVHTWVRHIRETTDSPCVWLLGHSEGGLASLQAAEQPGGLCGVILVATPGRKMGEILREQLKANSANAPLLPQAFSILEKLEAGQHVDAKDIHPLLMGLYAPQVQNFLIDLLRFDPAEAIRHVTTPILLLQGTEDMQISTVDADRLHAASSRSELVVLEGMAHPLKTVPSSDKKDALRVYTDPNLPLTPELVPAIVQFIQSHSAPGSEG